MVAPVDAGYASWLTSPALYTSWASSLNANLLTAGYEQEIISPFANKADADTEATRQGAFVGGPLVIDRHTIKGQRRDLIAQCVTLTHPSLGYSGGVNCFVLEVNELDGNLTELLVVRKIT